MKKIKVAVAGASGIVGEKIIELLENENFVSNDISLFSSKKNAGKFLNFRNRAVRLKEPSYSSFKKADLVFFATDEKISKKLVPCAINGGATVIDNSSAFRMDENVPLVVPEINFYSTKNARLIANPNCITAQCTLPLFVLQQNFGLECVTVTTYQSVSGSGKAGLKELFENSARLDDVTAKNSVFGCDIKLNCIPKIGDIGDDGYSIEEKKIINETRKILNDENLKITAFCVRVPVPYSHGAFISAKLKNKFTLDDVVKTLNNFSGITVKKPSDNHVCSKVFCPINSDATGNNDVFVGRFRINSLDTQTVEFFVVADNLLRGAAANAVLIARKLFGK